MAKHIYKGSGAPTFVPREAGHHYVDTLNGNQYLSVGTVTAGDWRLVTYGQYTNEQAQDAVGNILTESSTINFDYDDPNNTISATVKPDGVDHNLLLNYASNRHIDHSAVSVLSGTGLSGGGDLTSTRTLSLTNTGVTASSYGSATQVATYSVDSQGRLTASSSVSIAIPSSQITDFAEATQDIIGGMFIDSSSVDLTYNDSTGQISASVLPAGVDHNALLNYSANRHIDHSAVSISTGAGLTGGGDITSSRTLALTTTGVTGSSYGSATQVGTFSVDSYGRLTTASNVSIAIPSSQITDFSEAVQDLVGGSWVDTSTIDFTYNDTTGMFSAVVLPGGVDHNLLLNYSANRHIDHSAVSISAGSGLAGGGDITASRTISMPNVGTAGTYGDANSYPVITTDAQGRVTTVTTVALPPNPTSLNSSSAISTTSATYSTMSGMTTTPALGSYLVLFSCDATITADSNGDIALFVNGVQEAITTRNFGGVASGATTVNISGSISFMTLITVPGGQVVDVRFRENGGGTFGVTNRELILKPY